MPEYPATMRPGYGPGRCDFCSVRPGTVDYPLPAPFTIPAPPPTRQVVPLDGATLVVIGRRRPVHVEAGVWSACVPCAHVLAARDPERMADHVQAEWAAADHPLGGTDRARLLALLGPLLPRLGRAHVTEAGPPP
jgi:hypothetical protein